MKKLLLTFVFAIACAHLFAQPAAKPLPFILQGQISNCPEKQLFLIFKEDGKYKIDTIPLDNNGRFYLKTFKVTKPYSAQLINHKSSLTELYIAPGYNLTITSDARDKETFYQNKKVLGIGSLSNQYLFTLDSITIARHDTINWSSLSANNVLSYLNKQQNLRDSLVRFIFNRKPPINDRYFAHFKKLIILDNKFYTLSRLINHAIDDTSFNYQKTIAYIKDNFDSQILADLFKEEFLQSPTYRELMGNDYFIYLWDLDSRKDPRLVDRNNFNVQFLQKVSSVYKGKIQQLVLFFLMRNDVQNCRSFEELSTYKTAFPKYITELNDKNQQEELQNSLVSKGDELAKAQIGKPAPLFTAADSLGKTYNLTDYKGKVVYLDLWASWCGPCRAETPYFKTLYEKYKNDDRIVFMSVAVMDKPEDWRKALRQDKPSWLQLFDTDGKVQSSYVANSIPKFILINKQANIVSFDALAPYHAAELEKILNVELEK